MNKMLDVLCSQCDQPAVQFYHVEAPGQLVPMLESAYRARCARCVLSMPALSNMGYRVKILSEEEYVVGRIMES